MLQRLRTWLAELTFSDPLAQQHAPFIQFYLVGSLAVWTVMLPLMVLSERRLALAVTIGCGGLLLLLLSAVALVLLRRGRFRPAVGLAIAGITLSSTIVLASVGVRDSGPQMIIFAVPIMLAGLMLGRRGLLVTIATCCALVIAIGVLGAYGAPFIGFAAQPMAEADVVSVFVFAMLLIGVLLDRAGGALRRAFVATLAREQELRAVRAAQDEVIAERTAALQQSLEQAAAREATLQQTLAELRASEQTVRELSAPVLPVLPGVLIAPLVGALDSARAAALTTNVLQAVEQQQARTLILDITGVPTVDTAVAQIVLQTTAAVRLLGAEVLLVGIRPDVAHTMVVLGIQLRALQTFPNLEAALLALLGGRVPGQHKLAIPSRAA